jgi:hypothetical protein
MPPVSPVSNGAQSLLLKGSSKSDASSVLAGKLEKAWKGTKGYLGDLPYKGYMAVERPGGRQRYLRNMSDQEWRKLYGHRYMYSSDYIHANPKNFTGAVGFGARLANRTEEWGELTFRFTGCYCRFLGGIMRGSLREMAGAPRFGADLRRYLKKQDPQPFHNVGFHDFSQKAVLHLCQKKLLNFHGALTRALTPADALELIAACGIAGVTDESDQRVVVLLKGLNQADRARKPQLNSTLNQWVMSAGCVMSAGAFSALYMGTSLVLSGLDATFMAKMGMLAAGIYFTSFILRSAVTTVARLTHAYRGRPLNATPPGKRQYNSLFEHCSNWLRNLRNSYYQKPSEYLTGNPNYHFRSSAQLMDDEIVREIEFAQKMGACVYRDPNANWVYRGAMRVSGFLNRLGDVVFSLDRIVAQTAVQRPLKDNLFRYESDLTHTPLQSVHKKCNIDLVYTRSDREKLGGFRQSLASFIGHGGADVLGMGVGCGLCSAAWTALNIPMGGAMFTVNAVADLTAGAGLGFATSCAGIWAASASVATGAHIAYALSPTTADR